MSNDVNTRLEERLIEEFDIAMCDDNELRGKIAYVTLQSYDWYRFCKEDAWDLLDLESVYEKILEAFNNCEGSTFDIRALATKAYGIEI